MKKGQFQTLEPVIIVIILVFIIGVMLMFYMRISKVEGDKTATTLRAQEDLTMREMITQLPELRCTESETSGTYCIDLFKAAEFKSLMTDDEQQILYYSLFGDAKITLHKIDLTDNTPTLSSGIILYNALTNEEGNINTKYVYFTAHEPIEDKRLFAMVKIERQIP